MDFWRPRDQKSYNWQYFSIIEDVLRIIPKTGEYTLSGSWDEILWKKKNGIRYIIWTQSTMRPHQNLLGIISMDKHGTFHIKGQCIDVFKNDAWNGF